MYKIKLFKHGDEMVLEEYVNRFLAEHPVSVVDIQFRIVPYPNRPNYSVMVVYDTFKDDARAELNKLREKYFGKDDED